MPALEGTCRRPERSARRSPLPLQAQEQQHERCYPGPPLYILRELLGGQFTPERYRDAIVDYAKAKCRNGQTLKLVSPAGADAQDRLNQDVALELCDAETIYRERLAAGETALVLFCLVTHLDEVQ
jgi:hypothetical protein